jgi:hypothetical protein
LAPTAAHLGAGGGAALRRAWANPAVTCDAAPVPTAAERQALPAGIFRAPAKSAAETVAPAGKTWF